MNNIYIQKTGFTKANAVYDGQQVSAILDIYNDTVPYDGYEKADITKGFYFLKNAKKLRVFRVLPENLNPLISDFTILGFSKRAPYYDRGRKIKAEYYCPTRNELIVQKIFKDIRNETTGRLEALEITFNWFCEDGTLGLTKTEKVKEFNKAQSETEERKRRERSIDFLVSEAKYTPLESVMEALLSAYDSEVIRYKEKGNSDFANAIKSETNTKLLEYLNLKVPFSADPDKYEVPVKEAVLYQLYAITEQELMSSLEPISD